jgi:signal transduction histidine kinase
VALRDDFIAVASHELKTPVTSLKVYAEVLERQAVRRGDDQVGRTLAKMTGQIDRLALLIGDLLDVSKLEAGKLALDRSSLALDRLVGEVAEEVQQGATTHRIAIEGALPRPVVGDRDRLGQVLANLLTNAIKYSPRANRVVVRLSDRPEGATVEVEDFGIGIERAQLSKIFDRFYRVSSPEEKTVGTAARYG